MKEYTFKENGFTFIRIKKSKAESLYRCKLPFIICPVNLRPDSMWKPYGIIDPRKNAGETFNSLVNAFEYYNCINSETGRYSAFYAPVDPSAIIPTYDYKFMGE